MVKLERLLSAELRRNLAAGGRPRLPDGADILWGAFLDLSKARSYHAAGPNPISFNEIEAWIRLMRWPLRPHHVAIIRALDDSFIESFYRNRAQPPAGGKTVPQRSGHAVSPQLFDVIFG